MRDGSLAFTLPHFDKIKRANAPNAEKEMLQLMYLASY